MCGGFLVLGELWEVDGRLAIWSLIFHQRNLSKLDKSVVYYTAVGIGQMKALWS